MGLPIWPGGKDIKTVTDMAEAQKERKMIWEASPGPYATGGLVKTSTTIQLSDYTKKELSDMQEAMRAMGGAGVNAAEAGEALRKSMELLKLANANDGEIVERETISHYTFRNGYKEKDMEVDVNTGEVVWESEARKRLMKARKRLKEEEPKEPTKRAIDI